MSDKLSVSLIWQAVYHPPEGMKGWQAYRIEYGGHAESCATEGVIWLPRDVSPSVIERILRGERDKGAT